MLDRVPIKNLWAEQRTFARRAVVGGILAGLLTLGLVGRLIVLQVVNYDHFTSLSRGNRVRIEPLPPTRGLIFDRNGVLLAENLPAYQLDIVPEEVDDLEATLAGLGELQLMRPQDEERFRRLYKASRQFAAVPVRFRLSDDEVARFAVQQSNFPGVHIRARLARHYPMAASAVHAIGYVGSISANDYENLDRAAYAGTTHIGKTGVERAYEDALHGVVGYRQVLVNAQGRTLETLAETLPSPGRDLYLTLDVKVQSAAEAALGERRGAVVAIDPRNGGVLALASKPGYDPNRFGEGLSAAEYAELTGDPDKPLFDRALRGHYPPGSTIKPVLGLAGLHYGVIAPHDEINCYGFFQLPDNDHKYRDWKRQGHGPMLLHDAITQSCDVYYYELAMQLGIDRIHEFMSQFGYGQLTNIDVRGEKKGLLPSREWKRKAFSRRSEGNWYHGETVITGIGQGFMLATPLQLAHSTATLAARGSKYQPRLVSTIRDSMSEQTEIREPVPLGEVEVYNPWQWEQIIAAMEAVVSGPRGTARAIGVGAPYTIAGKTGTAQVFSIAQEELYDAEEIEERQRDHALFIAFAPADMPEIALAVLVENGGSGSSTAAPVARAVMDAYFDVGSSE